MDDTGAPPFVNGDVENEDYPLRKLNRERSRFSERRQPQGDHPERKHRRTRRSDADETFRCRHCKTMVGPAISGGRHRNHCPICLYSLHVDGKTPGDRAADCRSLMAPAGVYARRSGEQVIVHRCLGCGFERFNRVAADDNPLAVMRLALLSPPLVERRAEEDDQRASR